MNIKEKMLKNEKYLASYASFNKDAIRIEKINDSDIRPAYFRDVDRIIHSLAYSRYIDKTQVFSKLENDHITKRMIHVQLVSKIARTIGRALELNEDLIEAIALGHDIGHVPFGHLGESFLNEISLKHNEGYFMHNVQSVRTMMNLENNGKGINLTIQTLDGMLCHNGEFVSEFYKPRKKDIKEFLNDYELCYKDESHASSLVPMTLEGCVVRISDIIGYLGRDIEDAIRLNVLDIEDVPKNIKDVLGCSYKEIVNTIILDIINNSYGKEYITMSKEVYNAIKDLKQFNYINIYDKANSKEEKENIKNMFESLFDYLLDILKQEKKTNNIYKVYLNTMSDEYINNTSDERKVIDYIAGMTDVFFIKEFNKIKKSS